MKTLLMRLSALILLILIAAGNAQISAAQSPVPRDSDFSWLNGNWASRTGTLTMDIKVVNGNELVGSAWFEYRPGRFGKGQLQGKVHDDVIQISVIWEETGTSGSYEFRKQEDGWLHGTITAGNNVGRGVRLRKS